VPLSDFLARIFNNPLPIDSIQRAIQSNPDATSSHSGASGIYVYIYLVTDFFASIS
jgi:hypothetical protein